jgi:hypothetical protein
LLADFANFGSLASGKDCFCSGHGTQPSLLNAHDPPTLCRNGSIL